MGRPVPAEIRHILDPKPATPEEAAEKIRAELVCCDIYARVNDTGELSLKQARTSRDWHDLCYWGEAAARLAEGSADLKPTRPAGADAWVVAVACCPACQTTPGTPCHLNGRALATAHEARHHEAERTNP